MPDASPIPLKGMIVTGSGVSIIAFSAFNRVALQTGVALQPYRIDLHAASGKTMKTFRIAERVHSIGGYELYTNFVSVDDAHGLDFMEQDFLLGWNFLTAYNVLVGLTAMKIVVRAPAKPVWHHAHAQASDETLSSTVVLDQDVVLQPFERAILRFKCGTMLGSAAPVRLVYHEFRIVLERTKRKVTKNQIGFWSSSVFPLQTRRRRGCQNARSVSALTLIYWPLFLDPSLSWRRCKGCGDKLPSPLRITF